MGWDLGTWAHRGDQSPAGSLLQKARGLSLMLIRLECASFLGYSNLRSQERISARLNVCGLLAELQASPGRRTLCTNPTPV